MITDLADFSGLWVGLVKHMPNLEYVSFDCGFHEFLIQDPVKTKQTSKNGDIWVSCLFPLLQWKGLCWKSQTMTLEPEKADGMPNLMSCCLCDLGQATDPPCLHSLQENGNVDVSALGMRLQRGHSVQQMLASNICPQGGLGGKYDWPPPLAHISYNFALLLPMS